MPIRGPKQPHKSVCCGRVLNHVAVQSAPTFDGAGAYVKHVGIGFDRGEREHVSRGIHLRDERPQRGRGTDAAHGTCSDEEKVASRWLGGFSMIQGLTAPCLFKTNTRCPSPTPSSALSTRRTIEKDESLRFAARCRRKGDHSNLEIRGL